MSFSQDVVKEAWERADGKCQCKRNIHKHKEGVCNKDLDWKKQNKGEEHGAWATHHIVPKVSGGTDEISNCEILCSECHKTAASYGVF